MSQLASFYFFPTEKVPFLGAWSVPRRSLFFKSKNPFPQHLETHSHRIETFPGAGLCIALVFAIMEGSNVFPKDEDPVVNTVRKRIEGSHWLIEPRDRDSIQSFGQTWDCKYIANLPGFAASYSSFGVTDEDLDAAAEFICKCVNTMTDNDAILVSVG